MLDYFIFFFQVSVYRGSHVGNIIIEIYGFYPLRYLAYIVKMSLGFCSGKKLK